MASHLSAYALASIKLGPIGSMKSLVWERNDDGTYALSTGLSLNDKGFWGLPA